MARRIPEDRFDQLVDAALEVFIARGYRLTQMSDVAVELGVAKGTLYGYVESKEALFLLCLLHGDRSAPLAQPSKLPVPTPRPGQLSKIIEQLTRDESLPDSLKKALGRKRVEDAGAELETIVREFYSTLERYCCAIKLIDRCSDHPDLGKVWQRHGREEPRLALLQYLEMRMKAGQLRQVPDARLAARMIIEVVTTWAIHIKWDRSPEVFDPAEARENVVDFLVSALVP